MLRNEWKAVKAFSEAADMHLRASEVLLKECGTLAESELAHEAVYLAGYAVECILKARWLSAIRPKRHRRALQKLKKSVGHDFRKIVDLLAQLQKPVSIPQHVARGIRHVAASWKIEMRYSGYPISIAKAAIVLSKAKEIIRWCES